MLEIEKPTIFNSKKIIAGYIKKNLNLNLEFNLSRGLNFRFADTEEFKTSKSILAKELNVESKSIKIGLQIHLDNVAIINNHSNSEMLEVDALITNQKNVVLGGKSADCCIILFYDPVCHTIAAVHSGRRGTELNIVCKTVQAMASNFGSKAEDILAYLCPSAGFKTYTVNAEMAELWPDNFKKEFSLESINNLDEHTKSIVLNNVAKSGESKTYFLDMKGLIKQSLLDTGLRTENIQVSETDSIQNTNLHSNRRESENFGLGLGFIKMV